eukprot:TRINITY_DN1057_c0_g1_i1.p1 TRINITY_DN1057_c0_g1~~TRINITY_DN1057_c0_g1_i1.p1  ORF type:complete len:262 (-),score=64.41 TRINITY_DN1057_c0_g1_i1:38-823(-)
MKLLLLQTTFAFLCIGVLTQVAYSQDIGCLLVHCGSQVITCSVTSPCKDCLSCVQKCGSGNQTCTIICTETYGDDKFDALSSCMIENKCITPSPAQNCPVPPSSSIKTAVTLNHLDGTWYVLKGLNPAYDCYDEQTMSFHFDGTNWGYVYNMSSPKFRSINCNISSVAAAPGQFTVSYEEHGIVGTDHWYVVSDFTNGGSEFAIVYYCGSNPMWTKYQGAVVISKTKLTSISSDVQQALNKDLAVAASSLSLDKFCDVKQQ